MTVIAIGVLVRLVQWQVTDASELRAQMLRQHAMNVEIPARRGDIRDTNGDLLAGNLTLHFIVARPKEVTRAEDAARVLSPVLGTSASDLLPLISDQNTTYVRLLNGARFPQEVADQVAALNLPGIGTEPTTRRTYPGLSLAAQLLGFVDGEGIGTYGVEAKWNTALRGKSGRLLAERDNTGREIGISPRDLTPAENGLALQLTIDRTVQYFAERELERAVIDHRADGGTVIVMNPRTGAIMAMASLPTFDPNRYADAASTPELFVNPAVGWIYEPGSTLKIFTMAAALNERLVSPDTTMFDSGVYSVGSQSIYNWDKKGNGQITMTQLLEKSSNVGACWVSAKLGRERFYRYITAFGFGAMTGVDLPAESSGIVRTGPANWQEIDLCTNAFGQGISITPLQLVSAMAAVANGGIMMRPYVVKSVQNIASGEVATTKPEIVRQAISRDTAAQLMQMLYRSAEFGETRTVLVPGFQVAGKTGTASIPVGVSYDQDLTIASFVGAVPAGNPQFIILVKVDHPRDDPYGSLIAKPAFALIGQELTRYYRIPRTEALPPAISTADASSLATARAGASTDPRTSTTVAAVVPVVTVNAYGVEVPRGQQVSTPTPRSTAAPTATRVYSGFVTRADIRVDQAATTVAKPDPTKVIVVPTVKPAESKPASPTPSLLPLAETASARARNVGR